MDETLAAKVDELAGRISTSLKARDVSIRFTDNDGTVEIIHGDKKEPYKLKPLKALYGVGLGPSVITSDEAYMPLLFSIEEEIVRFDEKCEPLTDAAVALALKGLSMNPEQSLADPLAKSIQISLRLSLSLNNYSRQEVRQAIRKIEKSVARHNDGSRGYLEFIHEHLPGR
jgi:hypothetical protein